VSIYGRIRKQISAVPLINIVNTVGVTVGGPIRFSPPKISLIHLDISPP